MSPEHVRDVAAIAAIFGFFSSAWFGWAQEAPPKRWLAWLRVGNVLALLTTAAGGLLVWRHWSDGTVFDEHSSPRFGIVVAVEVVLAGAGAWFLTRRGRKELIPAWIALVVGVHFFPLAVILETPALHVVAILVSVAAWGGVWLARSRRIAVSAAVGVLTGTVLLGSGWLALADALTR